MKSGSQMLLDICNDAMKQRIHCLITYITLDYTDTTVSILSYDNVVH